MIDKIFPELEQYKDHKDLGRMGEDLAVDHLKKLGYKIIARNYRFGRNEVDIICRIPEKNMIVFVEVKTRESKAFGEPQESVINFKRSNIYKVVNGYMADHPEFDGYELRMDVISVFIKGKEPGITHFQDAF